MEAKGHVLYTEVHDDTRVLVEIMLREVGFAVTTATNGQQAYERLERGEHLDLYLLNHTFPDVSGVSLCMAIRELDQQTPILFYSARAFEKEREEAMKAGANDYLVKPMDIYKVAEHVSKWIAKSKAGPASSPSIKQ